MRSVLTVFPNSHEAARGHRGPATVEAQGQGVVCRSVVRNDRRGSPRGLGLALKQRQGSPCTPEEISIPNLEVDCCHRSARDDEPIRTRSSIDANVTSLSQEYPYADTANWLCHTPARVIAQERGGSSLHPLVNFTYFDFRV